MKDKLINVSQEQKEKLEKVANILFEVIDEIGLDRLSFDCKDNNNVNRVYHLNFDVKKILN